MAVAAIAHLKLSISVCLLQAVAEYGVYMIMFEIRSCVCLLLNL